MPTPSSACATDLLVRTVTAFHKLSECESSDRDASVALSLRIGEQFRALIVDLEGSPALEQLAASGDTAATALTTYFRKPTRANYRAMERARKAYNRALRAVSSANA